ncbi:hypothetical protein NC652_013536 [Populus alba x Populus x berolinensis]|uniref:Uncharacterized protein n=2 Tax=Populus TaxID=3689 RepID=A0ACC4CA37_POPAL|nr:hypothetical protein NC652_013536 [Populus alba x Populus x berolinensis]KAJ6996921.1 hypothetical protein NC653_013493 [Populus alba x Populus x berolinensis]
MILIFPLTTPEMAMAQSPPLYLLAILFFALLFKGTTSTQHNHNELKSLHYFVLCEHATRNKTGCIIVNGVAGPNLTHTTSTLGTLHVSREPMIVTSDPSSKVAGTV